MYSRLEWRWLVLGWVGLVPWLAVLDRAGSLRAALALGWLMSVTFTLAVFGWFALGIRTYADLSLLSAGALLAVVAPLVQPQFLTFAAARHLARSRSGIATTAIVGACVYVGSEWMMPKLFGDTLGHGLYASVWMRQAADLAGAPGLSLILLVANAAALAAARGRRGRAAVVPLSCVALLAVGLCAYGAFRLRRLDAAAPPNAPLTAGIVQGNLSHYDQMRAERGTYATVRTIVDTYFAMSSELLARAPLDLLVWPETVYPTTFGSPKSPDGAAFDDEITSFVGRAAVPLVFGSYDTEKGDEFVAAFFLEPPRGAPPTFATYRKAWPFPLTERVPAFLDSPRVRAWLPWLGTWKPGAGPKVVPFALRGGRTIRIAPLICYDVLDPGLVLAAVREGADLILTLSNDSWFASGAGPRLHLLGAAFRSIETRRPQLRATNTGISAVILPDGDIVERSDIDTRATLIARVVPGRWPETLVLAWGDWLGPVALAVGLAGLVALLLARSPRDGA